MNCQIFKVMQKATGERGKGKDERRKTKGESEINRKIYITRKEMRKQESL
jgi:hypothetical protein